MSFEVSPETKCCFSLFIYNFLSAGLSVAMGEGFPWNVFKVVFVKNKNKELFIVHVV